MKFVLLFVCAAAILMAIPTIGQNLSDPNLITYFNADEGGLMDEAWFYYSGVKRDSFQWDIDYGLEMVYVADVCRFFSRSVDFKPETFVLILRIMHLLAWIGCLIALWMLVGRHFGKGAQQAAAVLLLFSRPAFDYFINSLKPDFVVLLLMIIGLDYALRVIDDPSRKNLLISVACAAAAMVIKFMGVFLVPAIITAVYLGGLKHRNDVAARSPLDFDFKHAWLFPAAVGAMLIAAPFVPLFFYARKTSGLTYMQEFGFIRTVLQYKVIIFVWASGIAMILSSFVIRALMSIRHGITGLVMGIVNRLNSICIVVGALFAAFYLFFGLRWVTMPGHWLTTYTFHSYDFSGSYLPSGNSSIFGLIGALIANMMAKSVSFGMLLLIAFEFYSLTEFYMGIRRLETDTAKLYKRLVLCVYLMPFFAALLTPGRFTSNHMLPFFVAVAILAIQGIEMFAKIVPRPSLVRAIVVACIAILLAADFAVNAHSLANLRLAKYRRGQDVAFEVARWLRSNIPADSRILAEDYTRIYIPQEYKNVVIFRRGFPDRAKRIEAAISAYKPRYVYYNADPGADMALPELEKLAPNINAKLIAVFDASGRPNQQHVNSKVVVYELLDQKKSGT